MDGCAQTYKELKWKRKRIHYFLSKNNAERNGRESVTVRRNIEREVKRYSERIDEKTERRRA